MNHTTQVALVWLGLWMPSATSALAQTTPPDTTASMTEAINFDEFGDADDRKVKTFATQKVLYLSPTRLISLGYETQFNGQLTASPTAMTSAGSLETDLNAFRGLRLSVNTPVVSRNDVIVNLGLTYWNTSITTTAPERSALFGALNLGLRTAGINTTIFKPFDTRRFLIVQASADANGNYSGFSDFSPHHLTYSATAIYGWKKDDNRMWGLGLTRTYRGGNLLHIPVLLYNRTFNPKWGVEVIFPARAAVRRNFGTSSLLSLGYELEGNSFFLSGGHASHLHDWYIRRSEFKPRLNYERKLSGFVWLAVQTGVAINWRFDVQGAQNPLANEVPIFANQLRTAPYLNLSLNLVSP